MPKSRRRPSAIAITGCVRDITSANKAPGGFGLGSGVGQAILDANEATLGGFYYWGANAKNIPFRYGAMVVIPRSSNTAKPCVTQIASEELGGTSPQASIAVRKSTDNSDGSWGPWEWINPPMELGVEYRTTERYLGEPIYVKVVNCGVLPSGATLTVKHEIANVGMIVEAKAIASNSTAGYNGRAPFPQVYNNSLTNGWTNYLVAATSKEILIYCGGGLAGCSVYVTMRYTKATQ